MSISILELSVDLKVARSSGQLRNFMPHRPCYRGEGRGSLVFRI